MAGSLKRLERQFLKLERKKEQWMKLIQSLPEEIYFRQPTQESWSVGQTANHVFLSERLSLAYLKKKLSYPDQVPKFSYRSIGSVYLLKLTLMTSYKANAPKAINMWENQTVHSATDLEREWTALRAEMKSFILEHYPAFSTHLAYRHPIAGRMTMYQMLIFFNDHMKHHMKQADRILATLKHMAKSN